MELKKIPKELIKDRNIIECNFVLSLYKDISLLNDYKHVENGVDIIDTDGIFYYGLLQNIVKAGYSDITSMSIYAYLETNSKMKQAFEKRGGYATVKEILDLISVENVDKYYDDLVKNNFLIRLHNAGFNVLKELEKFNQMTAEEVYDYYEYQLSNISVGKIEKIKATDLSSGYEEFINQWDQGNDVGYKIGIPMLNYQLLGIHKSNLMLHLSGIGFGKTTSAIAWYIIPAIKSGNSCLVIANEQDESMWRQMILSTVMFNEITEKAKGLDRHKLSTGGFNDEQKNKMLEAQKWLDSQKGRIIFVETNNYDASTIRKLINKYSKLGVGLHIVDTLKLENDANEKSWGEFADIAKELFLIAKKNKVAVVATAQLTPDAMSRRYLDLTAIGRSKQIAEVANSVVMFRPLSRNEKEKIEAYVYETPKVQKKIPLNPEKDYICIFTPKNRYGPVTPQIIVERNMNFNSYKQIGWYECSYDQFKNK